MLDDIEYESISSSYPVEPLEQEDDDESVPPHLNEDEESEAGWDEEDDVEESEEDILAQLEVSKAIYQTELERKHGC